MLAAAIWGTCSLAGCERAGPESSEEPSQIGEACGWTERLDDWRGSGEPLFVADANLLTPYRMRLDGVSPYSESDLEFTPTKARRGRLSLAVLEILITSSQLEAPDVFEGLAEELAAVREGLTSGGELSIAQSTDETLARSPGAVRVMLGVENLAPVGAELSRLEILHRAGVRLATPVHSRPNAYGDSSYSEQRPHGGLSELGRALVLRMNQLGIIVDVSHMSDEALQDTARASTAPVIASHSGVRHFTPGWERNLSDAGIRAIAATGGVVHIPFSGSFLSQPVKDREQPVWDHVEYQGLSINSLEGRRKAREFREEHGVDYATVEDIVRQIDYVVDLAGIDHVGFGSSFDGSGESIVSPIRDASGYPHLVRGLCQAGYSQTAVEKIAGGNFLRVWSDVETIAGQTARSR